MTQNLERIAIVGIGSPHGDDQFGWEVVDCLNQRFGMGAVKISNPVDIIPMLDNVDRIVVVDAGVGLPTETQFRRLNCADPIDREWIADRPVRGTHDFALQQTLQLAQTLGKPIGHVVIWVGNAIAFDALSNMTSESAAAVRPCADAIAGELCHA